MIPGGAVVGGGEVSGVSEEGVGRAGPGRVGDGAGEGSWAPLPLPPGWRTSGRLLAPSAAPCSPPASSTGPPELPLVALKSEYDLVDIFWILCGRKRKM